MKQKLLVIEDEPGIQETLQFLLIESSYEPHFVSTAAAGLKKLSETDYALILLDLGLPDIDGLEFLKKVREKNSDLPIIILTARKEEIDKILGLEMGADDYITKPFSNRELQARIKALLRRTSSGQKTFEINDQAGFIRYKGQKLPLSLQEYLILKLMLSHPGWVFSREKILELTWQDPASAYDRTVDVHIKNIRQKLKQVDADNDDLITHRGMGYSIREAL